MLSHEYVTFIVLLIIVICVHSIPLDQTSTDPDGSAARNGMESAVGKRNLRQQRQRQRSSRYQSNSNSNSIHNNTVEIILPSSLSSMNSLRGRREKRSLNLPQERNVTTLNTGMNVGGGRIPVDLDTIRQASWPMCNDRRTVSILHLKDVLGSPSEHTATPHENVKIVHSIPFNGEPMSLLTIAYLYDVVDYFVIVESLQTFSGINRREFHIDKHSQFLQPYKDKIIEVRIERFPDWEADMEFYSRRGECVICWFREAFIRDVVKNAVMHALPNSPYILVHADGDELPKRKLFQLLPFLYDKMNSQWNSRANIMTTKFTYNFDWYSPRSWHRSIFMITDTYFQKYPDATLEKLRHSDSKDINHIFIAGAWHCSSCLSPEDIVIKLNSFSHQEINKEKYRKRDKILRDIATGQDMLNRKDDTYKSLKYMGQEGFPSLDECPKCINVPDFEEVLKLRSLHERAKVANLNSESSDYIKKARANLNGRDFFMV